MSKTTGPMRGAKRPPGAIETAEQFWRFLKLSKADWADAYADLYRQTHGDAASAEEWLTDAENRNRLLTHHRTGRGILPDDWNKNPERDRRLGEDED